jgi:hypothetical protein
VCNLHLVNGLGSTDCFDEQSNEIPDCPNGLGNLKLGRLLERHMRIEDAYGRLTRQR